MRAAGAEGGDVDKGNQRAHPEAGVLAGLQLRPGGRHQRLHCSAGLGAPLLGGRRWASGSDAVPAVPW